MDSLPALWGMKKPDLVQELKSYGITTHPSWTVPELREMIKEQREARTTETKTIKGLSRMSLQDLKTEAAKTNMMLPPKATRGVLMKMLRDQTIAPGDTICPFGRYKGWAYTQIPPEYLDWSVEEVGRSSDPSEDLVRR